MSLISLLWSKPDLVEVLLEDENIQWFSQLLETILLMLYDFFVIFQNEN